MAQSFQLLQPIRTLTFNIFRGFFWGGGHTCSRKQLTAVLLYVGAQAAPPSRLLRPLSVLPPPQHTRVWCQVGSALLRWSPLWSPAPEQCVGADLSLFCSQVAALKSHRAHQQMRCSSQIYSRAPRITAIQVFKRQHICLNTGIKLWWRERKNRSVIDSGRQKMQEGGENDIFHT